MAKPTFVATYEPTSNWTQVADAATRVTSSFSVLAGDILVVFAAGADASQTVDTPPVGGSLTWTLQEDPGVNTSAVNDVKGWTAVVDSNKSMTVTCASGGGTGLRFWGFVVYHFRGSDGVGAAESANTGSSAAPSLAITTTQANSAIVFFCSDWTGADGTSRTWRTINSITPTSGNGLEKIYFRNAAAYTNYSAYWDDAGTAAAKTTGLTTPSQQAGIIAIEVKGSAAGAQAITGALFTNSQTFFGATVSTTYDITGALFTNSNSFFGSTVSTSYSISGNLFTNSNTFFGSTVTTGAVNISGALFTNSNTFFGSTISTSYGVTGSLFTNSQTFFGATIAPGTASITGNLFTNSNSFGAATISTTYDITGALFTNAQTFYASTVANVAGGTQNITGALFTNTNTFFGATVAPGTVNISGNLFTNSNVFFSGTVGTVVGISGNLFTNTNTFFGATVSTSSNISGNLFTNTNTFFSATITGGVPPPVGGQIPTNNQISRRRRIMYN